MKFCIRANDMEDGNDHTVFQTFDRQQSWGKGEAFALWLSFFLA